MATFRAEKRVSTKGEGEMVDLTDWVKECVLASKLKEGIACVFASHSTAAIVLIEDEEGLRQDLKVAMERLAPKEAPYAHNAAWGDGNGHSHIRATALGQSVTFPFRNGSPDLGTWQQVLLVEMDNRGRERRVVLQLMGE